MRRAFAILLILLCTQVPVWALAPPGGPEPPPESGYPEILEYLPSPVEVTPVGSIGDALTHDNGDTVGLSDKVVTGRFTESGITLFYIQDDDRGAGIRVDNATAVAPGDRVNVTGTLGVIGGERRLYDTTVQITQHQSAVPGPLAMDNPTVGGAALNDHTPGITGAIGPYNKGLLVMTWGRVTSTSDGAFCIDDGSVLADGPGTNFGIRVIASGFTLPTVNQYVVITGISSSFEYDGVTYRQIRVRAAADVLVTTGTNVTSPPGLLDISPARDSWWAAVGLPGVPIDPNPESVFDATIPYMAGNPATLVGNIQRFEPRGDQDVYPYPYVCFPDSKISIGGQQTTVQFGCVYSGQGYWMEMGSAGGEISYQGVMEPVQSTDRYISLPCDALTWIGNPFDHSVLYQSVLVTDGKTVLSFMDAWRNNWIYPDGYWWNCGNQSLYMVEGDMQWADLETGICMRSWHGFWVCSNKDALALIIVSEEHETMSVTADPPYIAPGGSTQIIAKALLRSGYPLENAAIALTTTAGALSAPDGQTDQNGEVKVTLSSVPAGQSPVVTASSDYACPGPITGSCTIAIDTTPPSTPVVTDDGDYTTSITELHASWSASDPESGIAGYQYAIGTSAGATNVVGWTSTAASEATATELSLDTSGNTTYYFAVKAINGAGMPSDPAGLSDGITCQPQKVIHVKPNGNDQNNGLTWATAKATVQSGINAAGSTKEVWVVEGTYVPSSAITLASGTKLYGGFAGTELVRSDRNWKNHETILDGSSNHYNSLVRVSGVTSAVLDGFTLRHGGNSWVSYGGGIYCSNASLVLANNIVTGNSSTGGGGGFYAYNSSVVAVGNVFVDNTSLGGGAIDCERTTGQIAHNTVICNAASEGCGGISLYYTSAALAVTNNIVAFNAGGGIHAPNTSATFARNDVYGNIKYEYSTSTPVPATDIHSDPIIPNVELGDWHIAAASPCRDAGVSVPGLPEKDIDAESRTSGASPDIGADEWNGTDPAPVTAAVVYVKPASEGGSDSNNGTSWADAVATVQKGVDVAYSTGRYEVWVAAGTYAKVSLRSFVKLYGGFEPGDTSKSDRDWTANQTILEGVGSSSIVTIGNAAQCRVDGFIIQHGSASYGGGSASYGGGIQCSGAFATIAHNTVRANTASYGGGLWALESVLTIASNSFLANTATIAGGAIYASYDSTVMVAGNAFADNAASSGGGVYCCYNTSGSLANNTIVRNSASDNGGGVYLYSSSPALSNNIIAQNLGGGIKGSSSQPALGSNCVYGNTGYDYSGVSPGTGDFSSDPLFAQDGVHIEPTSPCVDAGDDSAVQAGWPDVDGEARIQGAHVDAGADESDGCGWYYLTLSLDPQHGTPGQTVNVTAHVTDWNAQPVVGTLVYFSLSGGVLTAIGGNALPPGTTGASADTDSNGDITAVVTRGPVGTARAVAAVTRSCGTGQTTLSTGVPFGWSHVGFVYDICYEVPPSGTIRSYVDQYLTRVDDADACVVYRRITGTPFTIDDSLNVVFLVTPTRDLQQSEIDALCAFVQSGRQKRIVLVGEFSPDSDAFNARLNNTAAGLGMGTRFSTGGTYYDICVNRARLCAVNPSHYLTAGVSNLWDAATSTFAGGWGAYARPVAYTHAAPTLPWILEEDTAAAGSRILIHDSSVIADDYNDKYDDTLPDKNFKFIDNLCTMFPQ